MHKSITQNLRYYYLISCPRYLVVGIRRFFSDVQGTTKINTKVSIPLLFELDMFSRIEDDQDDNNGNNEEKKEIETQITKYNLFGQVFHHGNKINDGHYTAIIQESLSPNAAPPVDGHMFHWANFHHFDDSTVKKMTVAEFNGAQKAPNQTTYFAIYQQSIAHNDNLQLVVSPYIEHKLNAVINNKSIMALVVLIGFDDVEQNVCDYLYITK